MSFEIRAAEQRDTDAIVGLSQKTLTTHREKFPEHFSSDSVFAEAFLAGLFRKHVEGTAFVAEQNGEIVGWTGMQRFTVHSDDKTHDEVGLIIDVTVAEKAQRQGIGRALLSALIDAAREQGVTKLEGDVWSGSESGHLLENVGIRKVKSVHEMRLKAAHSGHSISYRVGRFFDKLLPWLTVHLSIIVFAYVFGG